MLTQGLRVEGTLRSWDDKRGFGFLASAHGADTFVHISAFDGRPQQGDRFSYVIGLAPDGRPRAEELRAIGDRAPRRRRPGRGGAVGLLAIPAFALLFIVLVLRWDLPDWIALVYGAASALAFVVYSADKLAARAGWQRVSEASLILLGFVGGWPGALLAQQLLRHKTVKESFQRAFWQSVMLNVTVVVSVAAALHYRLFS